MAHNPDLNLQKMVKTSTADPPKSRFCGISMKIKGLLLHACQTSSVQIKSNDA